MNIIWHEMRKIFNWKILAVIVVFSALWYVMFLEFNIKYYPNGHPPTEIADLMIEINELYGTTVTEEQLLPFLEARWEELEKEANIFIQSNPEFAEFGIYNIHDFEEWRQSDYEWNEAASQLNRLFYGGVGSTGASNNLGYRLGAVESLREAWDYALTSHDWKLVYAETNYERQRIIEVVETGEYKGTMFAEAWRNTLLYFGDVVALLMGAVLLIIAPLITTDRLRNVHYLQYSSKQGWQIIRQQFTAVALSSVLITTVMLLIFGAIFSQTRIFMYWNHNITSFQLDSPITIFRITFGNYILILIALVYILCLSVSFTAFIISRFSRNLITATIKVIPVFVTLWFFCVRVFSFDGAPLTFWSYLYHRTHIPGIEPIVCATLLSLALAASLWIIRREKCLDVV